DGAFASYHVASGRSLALGPRGLLVVIAGQNVASVMASVPAAPRARLRAALLDPFRGLALRRNICPRPALGHGGGSARGAAVFDPWSAGEPHPTNRSAHLALAAAVARGACLCCSRRIRVGVRGIHQRHVRDRRVVVAAAPTLPPAPALIPGP